VLCLEARLTTMNSKQSPHLNNEKTCSPEIVNRVSRPKSASFSSEAESFGRGAAEV
jgi:hypothetical protein